MHGPHFNALNSTFQNILYVKQFSGVFSAVWKKLRLFEASMQRHHVIKCLLWYNEPFLYIRHLHNSERLCDFYFFKGNEAPKVLHQPVLKPLPKLKAVKPLVLLYVHIWKIHYYTISEYWWKLLLVFSSHSVGAGALQSKQWLQFCDISNQTREWYWSGTCWYQMFWHGKRQWESRDFGS